MPSLTVENYLKAALLIGLRDGSEWISTGDLASALGVSPGTVTSMLKSLSEARPKLASYRPYEGVCLTRNGRKHAMRMLRRHRLIELFLVRTLDLSWDQVHEEAEHMEHAVSDFLIDRIDDFLGHPACDPHGDPIPSAEGQLRADERPGIPLCDCPAGEGFRFVRVTNQNPEFLRFLTDHGIELGVTGLVRELIPEAGIMTVEFDGTPVTLGLPAAAELLVEPQQSAAADAEETAVPGSDDDA